MDNGRIPNCLMRIAGTKMIVNALAQTTESTASWEHRLDSNTAATMTVPANIPSKLSMVSLKKRNIVGEQNNEAPTRTKATLASALF